LLDEPAGAELPHRLLARLHDDAPDFIILDVWLAPELSGWDVLDTLGDVAILRTVPVIICSAVTTELRERRDRLEERGIVAVEKPFAIEDLYHAVESALARTRRTSG
jgi:DNA-binding response OmpR family regulator